MSGFLINPSRFGGGGGGGGGSWTPASLTNLYAWFDASQQTDTDGAACPTLVDYSGNGYDFSASGTGPLMARLAINGADAFHFNASEMTRANTFLAGLSSAAVFFVAEGIAGGGSVYGYCDNFSNFTFTPYTDGKFYTGLGHATRHSYTPPMGLSTPYIFGEHVAVGDWEARFNGADAATATFSPSAVAWNTNTRRIGSGGSTASRYNGYVGEIIFCNSVPSTSDRQKIEGYLAWKFALESNLPADHPYKSAAP